VLLSFRFANHRSFRDEQQLNLLPVYDVEGEPLAETPFEAVPVAGIFGANASGKSNIISAFSYLSRMVGLSDRISEPGPSFTPRREPFRLDPNMTGQPSSYAVDVLIQGVRHTYGFAIDEHEITEEWLYAYPLRRKRVVFERTGLSFDWGEESRRSSIRRLEEIIAPTALFLSVAARFDAQPSAKRVRDETTASLHEVFSWIYRGISRVRATAAGRRNYAQWLMAPGSGPAVLELLRAADVGLEGVTVHMPAPDDLTDDDHVPERVVRPGHRGDDVQFLHRGFEGNVAFDLADESSGTLRLFELTARALPILEDGGLFLVDEIDASLHPLLTATLIRLFQSPATNKSHAQLVFTTHDATLLGSIDGEDVLRRDEVWFTSKREDGSSELFPLAEFKPRRQGENRQKRYLNGSYGAIPDLSMSLFERAVNSRAESNGE
jgi:uncharacterized protein